jgi:hypothetical protein
VNDLFIEVVFVSRGFRFLFLYENAVADSCVYCCTRLMYMFLLIDFVLFIPYRYLISSSE